MTIELMIGIGGFILAVTSSLTGFMFWFANSEKKKYAAERDFQHIRKNQEQTNLSLATILSEIDKRFDILDRDILEIKMNIGMPINKKRIGSQETE